MPLNELTTIGKRLRALRVNKGYTQEALAIRTGTTQARIQKIENGKSLIPRCTMELASEFEVNPAWLQFGHEYAPMRIPEFPFGTSE